MFNEDVEAKGLPAAVQKFRQQIKAADGIIFGSPEYNYSVSGVLKNAIDSASRRPEAPLAGKPAGIIGASMGQMGTARAQCHLRQIGVGVDLHFLNRPEVMIAKSHEKFDAEGNLTDEPTREQLRRFAAAFVAFASK